MVILNCGGNPGYLRYIVFYQNIRMLGCCSTKSEEFSEYMWLCGS